VGPQQQCGNESESDCFRILFLGVPPPREGGMLFALHGNRFLPKLHYTKAFLRINANILSFKAFIFKGLMPTNSEYIFRAHFLNFPLWE
jgi:hypothetical protein